MIDTALLLDNPIWHSLSTRHARFARGGELAKRFQPEIGPLAGIREQSPEAYAALENLFDPDEPAGLFLDSPPQIATGWRLRMHKPIEQMVCLRRPEEPESNVRFEPLGTRDIEEMLELTALTEPGPFQRRTAELGGFVGIREDGRLAAMAGQRLMLPGFTEISAVCTHPDFRGRGYARLLVAAVAREIYRSGETPYLTVLQSNTGAIGVYESVGFAVRRTLHLAILVKQAPDLDGVVGNEV